MKILFKTKYAILGTLNLNGLSGSICRGGIPFFGLVPCYGLGGITLIRGIKNFNYKGTDTSIDIYNSRVNDINKENKLIGNNKDFENINTKLFNIKNDIIIKKSKRTNKKSLKNLKNKYIELKREAVNNLAAIKGGYTSYNKFNCVLGNIMELMNLEILRVSLIENLMNVLDGNKLYALLVNLHFINDGHVKGISPMKSMIVTGDSNVNYIAANIINGLNRAMNEYDIISEDVTVRVYWREWVTDAEYKQMVSEAERTNITNEVLEEESKLKLDTDSKLKKITKFMKIETMNTFVNELSYYDKITELEIYCDKNHQNDMQMYNFITELERKHGNVTVTVYKGKNDISKENSILNECELYFVFNISSNKRVVCLSDYKSWNKTIEYWNSFKYPYPKWTDEYLNESEFVRSIGEYNFHVKNGMINYWEKIYSFPDMVFNYPDKKQDLRIGSLDLETYGDNSIETGLGNLDVYAGGFALNDGFKNLYYLNNELNSGDALIKKMFSDLFDYIAEDRKTRNNYTIYAHNLGRFDSVFIIRSLCSEGYKLNGQWIDNSILYLKITDIKRKLTIKLRDSIKLIPQSLNKALTGYGCQINKGMFPHNFVNKDNLNYIGAKPEIKFYVDTKIVNESNLNKYNSLPNIFNLKTECLNYLEKDILGLLELMNKVSVSYFNEYKLNITKFSTLASITLNVFGIKFYDDTNSIKLINGPISEFIRSSYFGGNSDVFVYGDERLVKDGYHYDMNSQYPYGMKNVMPTGNPVFSTNTNLDYYKVGFVFARITPPSKDVLTNLFIQSRNEDGSVSCPRTPFYEYIATPDLRQGLEYGYKFEILCGINFPDASESSELFTKFVNHFYEIKSSSKDLATKYIAKLSLNSLYGKFGQKEREYSIRLLEKETAKEILTKNHYSYMSEVSENYILIKSGGRLNAKLRRLYAEHAKLNTFNEEQLPHKFTKTRGIPSAVQISAIISSYARTSINPFKNIAGNLAIASNTDSLILRKPLDDNLISTELGKWKLEHKFKNGVFVKPKLYCYEDFDNSELIRKASGVTASKLTYENYVELAKGKDVLTSKEMFRLNWEYLNIEIVNIKTKISGIKDKI